MKHFRLKSCILWAFVFAASKKEEACSVRNNNIMNNEEKCDGSEENIIMINGDIIHEADFINKWKDNGYADKVDAVDGTVLEDAKKCLVNLEQSLGRIPPQMNNLHLEHPQIAAITVTP